MAKKQSVNFNKELMNDLINWQGKNLTDEDFRILAEYFDIPIQDAKDLIDLINSCFSQSGRFLRGTFEKYIPFFVWYGKNIFEFMWYFLKEKSFSRTDRVAFLNALQLLIDQLKEPKTSIKILLRDFLIKSESVLYSDRNALLLCNLLIRKYNKELSLDIEMTPEEVLMVKEGLNKNLTKAVAEAIDAIHHNRLGKKVRTIYLLIIQSLEPSKYGIPSMPLRYLISLERELIIFLSLVGGQTAHAIVRSAIKRYGNPDSEIYRKESSRKHINIFLQHLKLIIRAIARFGTSEDLSLLTKISWGESGFKQLVQGTPYEKKVTQIMKWVDISRDRITQKDMKDSRDTVGFKFLQ